MRRRYTDEQIRGFCQAKENADGAYVARLTDDEAARAGVDASESALVYTVTVTFTGWVNQTTTSFVQARSEAIRLVKLALEREGYRMPEPAFRLRFEGEEPALPAGKGKGKAAKPTSADQAETSDAGDTAADKTVEQRVAEERANSGASDLLDSDAKQEI